MSKTVASVGTTAVRPGTGLARLLRENPALRIGRDDHDINVTADHGERLTPDEVADALRAHAPWPADAAIESVRLGGGTASPLGTEQLRCPTGHVRASCTLTGDCEISLEGTPDNFPHDEPAEACEIGFDRFSVDVPSQRIGSFADAVCRR
ncbi:hypothetical protein [Streptomyces sp. H51]|uniref:hypothetical protein n=1 Tax=Streptomyces sp. H51 TaxID=3111770 RepID=UPI002D76D4ED|nr:hypothetical protein [Streptomyces sp. H51]